jgi:hypothetical protein
MGYSNGIDFLNNFFNAKVLLTSTDAFPALLFYLCSFRIGSSLFLTSFFDEQRKRRCKRGVRRNVRERTMTLVPNKTEFALARRRRRVLEVARRQLTNEVEREDLPLHYKDLNFLQQSLIVRNSDYQRQRK